MSDIAGRRVGILVSSLGLLPGGLESTLAGLAAGLADRGASVTIVAGASADGPLSRALRPPSTHWIHVPCIAANRPFWHPIARRRPGLPLAIQSLTFMVGCAARPDVRALISGADVTLTALEVETVLVSRWRAGRPNVSIFPGVIDPKWIRHDRSTLRLAVSRAVAARTAARGGVRIDGVLLSGPPPAWLETPFVVRPIARTLLYVGRLEPNKGVLDLVPILEALAPAFPDLTLRIVGEGPLRAKLAERLDRSGLSVRAALPGALPHADVRRELKQADLFLFPSRYESFSQALLEAAAVGGPVVASDVAGNREALGDAARLLPPG
ncbi:MAG TPA: glycosyltransferase family 4 protein, partial [Candidatus Limnocylindrales bacterium]|nr:glycosyltransferase family 4 protein [Candidatus Limnocylindrales bacterium]